MHTRLGLAARWFLVPATAYVAAVLVSAAFVFAAERLFHVSSIPSAFTVALVLNAVFAPVAAATFVGVAAWVAPDHTRSVAVIASAVAIVSGLIIWTGLTALHPLVGTLAVVGASVALGTIWYATRAPEASGASRPMRT